MRIHTVNITGYRSLYQVTVEPGNLTVLTGPNNSGKTNFVEAIDFLAEVYRYGLESAISRKGGIENIVHRRMARTKRSLAFEVITSLEVGELAFLRNREQASRQDEVIVTHRFVILPASQRIDAEYRVSSEYLAFFIPNSELPFFELTRENEDVTANVDAVQLRNTPLEEIEFYYDSDLYQRFPTRPTDLVARFRFNPIESSFARAMGNIRLYQLAPLECRRPGVPAPNAEVDRHGQNLPALVAYLQKHHSSSWRRVIAAMQAIVPELVEIKTEYTPDRRLALQFVEKGVRRPWSAEDISDGTMQALGMYTAIFDPRTSLILFEEPENSLHSWVIRNFVDACRAAEGRQVILTTHSAVLLSYLAPKEVSLVWKANGQTNIRRIIEIQPEIESLWSDGNLTVFEMLDSGLLREAIPGGDE
jgi:predicted ATPase